MAFKGDTVKCPACEEILVLENDRFPYHRDTRATKPGKAPKVCIKSGASAENYDPEPGKVYAVNTALGRLVLACPACKSKYHVKNAPRASSYPLACGKCGEFGTAEEFLAQALEDLGKQGRKHRYEGP